MGPIEVIEFNQRMSLLLEILLLAVALLLLIPTVVFFVECLVAAFAKRPLSELNLGKRPRVAVLVPAHDEAAGITKTLNAILPQLNTHDRLIVVADNCSDETAMIARQCGATAIDRFDSERRGKGYALDFGLQFLATDPPDVVVIVDADCGVTDGVIQQISSLAFKKNQPVQAIYLLDQPAKPTPKDAISALAFTVKNLVRPLGLMQLGLPCLLTGTGMAFPWSVIGQISLASGNIVEDMQLSLDLLVAGYPTLVCGDAIVTGSLPQQRQAAKSQRTRWEHGHLQTLLTQVPRLIKAAMAKRRIDILAMALDLAVPPLSLLVMAWLGLTLAALILWLLGGYTPPLLLLLLEGLLILVAVIAAWSKFARQTLPIQVLLSVPLYILWKVPLYFSFLVKPQTKWVRTQRDVQDTGS